MHQQTTDSVQWVEDEIQTLIKVWITVLTSLTFSYFIVKKLPPGIPRLLTLLPIISLFTYLPLNLTSIHFIGITSFFITWLCNFKLLLVAFNGGPLSSSSLSFPHFLAIACFPINIKQSPSPQHQNTLKSPLNYAIKALLLAFLIKIYDYKQFLHKDLILSLYCCHLYLGLEIGLAMSVIPIRVVFGFEIEPQFDDPYLTTSLQDFWGKRWNLVVTSILRPTVYLPIRCISTPILGRYWAQLVGLFMTFVVSGLMHELVYFYLSRVKPTWEVTWFFLLHGVCTGLEVVVKKMVGNRWRLHPVISGILTLGFVTRTGFWLFFKQVVRCGIDVRGNEEYGAAMEFLKSLVHSP
ncbi:hypothetical protein ACHQM5_030438 [Ranunculus cassubicifolius]